MLRITVFGHGNSWSFCPGATAEQTWRSAYKATQAAVAYGDTLEGTNLGYIIRMLIPGDAFHNAFPVETHVFVGRPAAQLATCHEQ